MAGGGRVLVLFQPHLYSRTRAFATQFAHALDLADAVVLTDIYGAREDPDPTVTSALITDQVATPGKAELVPDRWAAARRIAELRNINCTGEWPELTLINVAAKSAAGQLHKPLTIDEANRLDAGKPDQARRLEFAQLATDCFDPQSKIVGNIAARHR